MKTLLFLVFLVILALVVDKLTGFKVENDWRLIIHDILQMFVGYIIYYLGKGR